MACGESVAKVWEVALISMKTSKNPRLLTPFSHDEALARGMVTKDT